MVVTVEKGLVLELLKYLERKPIAEALTLYNALSAEYEKANEQVIKDE